MNLPPPPPLHLSPCVSEFGIHVLSLTGRLFVMVDFCLHSELNFI